MKEKGYQLKLHKQYYKSGYKLTPFSIMTYLFLFVFPVLYVFGSGWVEEMGFAGSAVIAIYVFYEFLISLPVILSHYDQKKGYTTTENTDSFSLEHDSLIGCEPHYGSLAIPAKEMPKLGILSSEEELYMNRFTYKLRIDQKKSYVWAFYTEDKEQILFSMLLKLKLQRTKYPMAFTYYTHGHILIDIDLVEGYDYPENFVKRFYEIKEMY